MTGKKILVAGDVCLDVVGVWRSAKSAGSEVENWRLTGETRTHYLLGGTLLLADLIRQATDDGAVVGPHPVRPAELTTGLEGPLGPTEFLALAPRLCREEVLHSLLRLAPFESGGDAKKGKLTLRVESEEGYSGPKDGSEPSMEVRYPGAEDCGVVVLDDTGNSFRHGTARNPWPEFLKSSRAGSADGPLVVYKLHRPLPKPGKGNPLWEAVRQVPARRCVVIVPVEDLRSSGVSISEGLSWERTALDVVWQLMNHEPFAPLAECRWLVIRLGLDGAILWRGAEAAKDLKAFLVYDPEGIESSFARAVAGRMVGAGSAFTAAVAGAVSRMGKLDDDKLTEAYLEAIRAGLLAARRLYRDGFGPAQEEQEPDYPKKDLFGPRRKGESGFPCERIPIIPESLVPDRSGWRLLDQIFDRKTSLLHCAVQQHATNSKPPDKASDPSKEADRKRDAAALLAAVPKAVFGGLRTHDRREIENYRSLHTLLLDYLRNESPIRPLSIAVFGPPGAGKSFGVKHVAKSLKGQQDCRDIEPLTFNLALYDSPDELAGAFHLVRDVSLKGKVPMVFFDEFDTSLHGQTLAWLRHFLVPMQDGEFLDRGAPHPIGPAIFVFAGGTCDSYRQFASHPGLSDEEFKARKGPDFLSRLRAKLDIPSLNLLTARLMPHDPACPGRRLPQAPGTFDPFGPVESLPSEAAVLMRRASILSFNLSVKAPCAKQPDGSYAVDPGVLGALLFLPGFEHGNRSFEALLDMSHLLGARCFNPSNLPVEFQLPLHADPVEFLFLARGNYPFPPADRETIARGIHEVYLEERRSQGATMHSEPSLEPWKTLPAEERDSSFRQGDGYAARLRSVGLWFRKMRPGAAGEERVAEGRRLLEPHIEKLAREEHDRWVAEKRSRGWIAARDTGKTSRNNHYLLHNCVFPWENLSEAQRDLDRMPMRRIPEILALAGYEVIPA